MAKKQFKFEEHWAPFIYRINIKGVDKIAAHVMPQYSEDDIDRAGPPRFVGFSEEPVHEMVTDTDKESDTFGERIPKQTEWPRMKRSYTIDFDKKSIANFRKMAKNTHLGVTKFVLVYKEHAYEYLDEDSFFSKSMKELYPEVVLDRKRIILESLQEERQQ